MDIAELSRAVAGITFEEVALRIRAAASTRTTLTYSDAYGGNPRAAHARARSELGALVLAEHMAGRPLLTVVVVEKTGRNKGRPGPGLFKIAKQHDAGLTRCHCGVDLVGLREEEPEFVARQLELVYRWWADGVAGFGTTYRSADGDPHSKDRDPFTVDPDLLDRANGAHARTQTALHDYVEAQGYRVVSWASGEPMYDLAWETPQGAYVAEVKSLRVANERLQLRLGLGQVLDYQDALATATRKVVGVLAVEREPADLRWLNICARHGVLLVWPGHFAVLP